MAAVITQNNIIKVVKSNMTTMNDLIAVINSSINTNDVYSNLIVNKTIKSYEDVMNALFGKEGLLAVILSSYKVIQKSTDKLKYINRHFDNVIKCIRGIAREIGKLSMISNIDSIQSSGVIDSLNDQVSKISEILKTINKLKVPKFLLLKMLRIKMVLHHMKALAKSIIKMNVGLVESASADIAMGLINQAISPLKKVLNNIAAIKFRISTIFKIKLLKYAVKKLRGLAIAISEILTDKKTGDNVLNNLFKSIPGLIAMRFSISLLAQIIAEIQNIKVGIKFLWKLHSVKRAFKKIGGLVNNISEMFNGTIKNQTANFLMLYMNIVFLRNIIGIIDTFNISRPKKFNRKIERISAAVSLIGGLVNKVSETFEGTLTVSLLKTVGILQLFLLMLKGVVTSITFFIIPVGFKRKINKICKAIELMDRLRESLALVKINKTHTEKLGKIMDFLNDLNDLFIFVNTQLLPSALKFIICQIFVGWSVSILAHLMNRIETKMKKVKLSKTTAAKFTAINDIFKSMVNIFNAGVKNWRTAGLFILVSAIWILSVGALILVIKAIKVACELVKGGRMVAKMTQLLSVISMLAIVGAALLILDLIAIGLVKGFKMLQAFFGIVTLSIVEITLIGLLCAVGWEALLVAGIGLAAAALVISVLFIIGAELLFLQTIELDREAILNNVQTIFDVIKEIAIGRETDINNNGTTDPGWVRFIVNMFENIAFVASLLGSMPKLIIAFVVIGIVKSIAKELNKLQKIELNEEGITTSISTIFKTIQTVTDEINNQDRIKHAHKAIKNMRHINRLIRIIKRVNKNLSKISKAGATDMTATFDVIKGNMQYIADNFLFDKIKHNQISTLRKVDTMVRIIKRTTKNMQKIGKMEGGSFDHIVDTYSRFIQKINDCNPDNLRQTTSMFEQMARFSESISGNFEGLADALNEKIMPMLEELKDLMEKLPEQVEAASAKTTNAIQNMQDAVSGKTPSRNEVAAQVKAEQPNLTGAELQAEIDRRIKSQVSNMSNSIVSKLDEIKKMLADGIPVTTS